MEIKICSMCKEKKTIDNFSKKKEKYSYYCKDCNKKYLKEYYEKMKNNKNYLLKRKKYFEKYIRPQTSIDKHKEKTKEWKEKNAEHIKEYAKKYKEQHKEEIKKKEKQWINNNRDKYREYRRKDSQRRKNNPILKLELQLRNMLNTAFKRKNYKKNSKLESIVGLNSKEMVDYLLQTFKNNYGYEWDGIEKVHIDHIKPLKNCKTEEEVYACCHHTNLQLLKAKDNMEKGSKTDWKIEIRNCE